jgi:hypothetical protein
VVRLTASLTILAAGAWHGEARAADSEPIVASSSCPESQAVWSTVIRLVPSAETQLLAAKPHVEIVDLGERYRVHVLTEGGALERTYSDPARDCDRRARFAAEFIVVAVLPPQLAMQADTARPNEAPGGSSDQTGAAPPPSAPPPMAPRPAAEHPPPQSVDGREGQHAHKPVLRIEVAGVAQVSPPVLGAPGVIAWGGDLRARVGAERFGGLVGVGYLPKVEFDAGNFRGAVTRVPALAGLAVRVLQGSFRIDGSVAAMAAFERYEGVSPHVPSDGTRLAPGLEVGLTASPHALAGLAPILSLSGAWMPLTQELVAAPQGDVAKTPSLWFGAALGMSLEL